MEQFTVTTQLTLKSYRKIMWVGIYKKPVFILSMACGLLLLVFAMLAYSQDMPVNYFNFFVGLLLLIFPSLIVWISVGQFKSNPSFSKPIVYTFDEEGYRSKGETFKTEIAWKHIIKTKEIDNFLILYHTKKTGNFIDKAQLNTDQLHFIKSKVSRQN